MASVDAVMNDLRNTYVGIPIADAFTRLYSAEVEPIRSVFASFHERANGLFLFLNSKMDRGRHFNAEQSRTLMELTREIEEVRSTLSRISISMELREDYKTVLEDCAAFLVGSGGSAIPDGFGVVALERYEPVFSTQTAAMVPPVQRNPPELRMVGEGAFAIVHKYKDDHYGFRVAVKVAKKGIGDRDLERFQSEYEIMKALSFPYIVQVYGYDATSNSYSMEFCEATLGGYIAKHNGNPNFSWGTRKRIALQFLYGVNYLHAKKILHRDISRNNVLVKEYDRGAVVVKLSDFGLHKRDESEFTKVDSSVKGTIIDPTLTSFKDFAETNDIYAVGHLLSFVFTGKTSLGFESADVQGIVQKCTDNMVAKRYKNVAEIIADVDALVPPDAPSPAETPA
ncbi:serine/threonine protein kinase [Cryobacterium sp. LW097]|uniref:protein kinase family protein n=1 Tax=Cryobacterium sp. LW097 TaxID=1978566 RepID=UPI000B4C6808|nr:protein kinase family protein [Cryobacterium sp. LW097]ASD21715.1 serine/threonine protein kinase [Cryobacterium sp. LW097]